MRRFNFGEEDEEEDYEDDEKFIHGAFSQFPFENESLISSAIKICESSFFWKFYSIDKKLKILKKTYDFLEKLLDEKLLDENL